MISQFLANYELTVIGFLIAFLATLLLGIAKAGIKGLGILIVTLMVFVFGGKASTGVLMPLMLLADVFAVIYYHRHTQWIYLRKLLPMMFLGVLIGVFYGGEFSESIFKNVMAVLILLSITIMIYMDKKYTQVPQNKFFGLSIGLLAGFTSMVGNLAGSLVTVYFLAMRLPKKEFIGTAAWLFFCINLFKLPFHVFAWGTIHVDSLRTDLLLMPGIFLGFLIGISVVKLFSNQGYRKFIFAVTAIGALIILIDN